MKLRYKVIKGFLALLGLAVRRILRSRDAGRVEQHGAHDFALLSADGLGAVLLEELRGHVGHRVVDPVRLNPTGFFWCGAAFIPPADLPQVEMLEDIESIRDSGLSPLDWRSLKRQAGRSLRRRRLEPRA